MLLFMSYEGHYQLLCARGHGDSADAYDFGSTFLDTYRCDDLHRGGIKCGAPVAWYNSVDNTNGDGVEVVLVVCRGVDYDICESCDHRKLRADATYVIPEREGTRVSNRGWPPHTA